MEVYVNGRFLTQQITGVQRYAVEIARELKKALGNKVIFLSPSGILHKTLSEELGTIIIGRRMGHLWEQIDLPLYLNKKGKPLLINLANTAPILYRNKISTIHDIAFKVFPKTYSKSFLCLYKFLIPRIIKSSVRIITVSIFSKNEIIKYYEVPSEKIHVIYNGVHDEFTNSVKDELKNKNYFLAVFSLNYRKNVFALLDSFLELKKNDVSLFLVGDINTSAFTKVNLEKYKQYTQIKFLGRISDEELIQYYSNAIGFVYPSFYEGFGIPPLEAQRCGCPVIVSNTSCLPEIFKESVLYCDPFSKLSIRDKMDALLNNSDLLFQLKEKGYQNSLRFSWKVSSESLLNIIYDINTIP